MKKKFKLTHLLWSFFSLFMFFVFHYLSTISLFGNGLKIFALIAFVVNVCLAFGVKIPYLLDNRKLPKNYKIYTFTITLILVIVYIAFKD